MRKHFSKLILEVPLSIVGLPSSMNVRSDINTPKYGTQGPSTLENI
jgi:hypothetical protein